MNERKPDSRAGNFADNTLQPAPDHHDGPTETASARSAALSRPHRPWAPNISNMLKAPVLPNVNPRNISHGQAYAGIAVHIPGSPLMEEGDTIVFHWGMNESSTRILHAVGFSATVRVLCITYNFIEHMQFGLVDVYFEVYRRGKLIGTSPAELVTVHPDPAKRPDPQDAES